MNLFKCERPMFISYFNVWLLNGHAWQWQGNITMMSENYLTDVTCIQELRIHHPEEAVRHQDLGNGWMIITASAEKAENKTTIRGVGMLVSPRAHGSLPNVKSVSPRITVATFHGYPKTKNISCHCPTNCSDEIEAVEFYSLLQDVIR